MLGTSLVPWSGLRDLAVLVKGLSGKEEDLGSPKTPELALRTGRDPGSHLVQASYPGKPTCLHILRLSSYLLCLTL